MLDLNRNYKGEQREAERLSQERRRKARRIGEIAGALGLVLLFVGGLLSPFFVSGRFRFAGFLVVVACVLWVFVDDLMKRPIALRPQARKIDRSIEAIKAAQSLIGAAAVQAMGLAGDRRTSRMQVAYREAAILLTVHDEHLTGEAAFHATNPYASLERVSDGFFWACENRSRELGEERARVFQTSRKAPTGN